MPAYLALVMIIAFVLIKLNVDFSVPPPVVAQTGGQVFNSGVLILVLVVFVFIWMLFTVRKIYLAIRDFLRRW